MSDMPRQHYLERFALVERKLRELGYDNIVNPTRVWACRWPWLYRLVGYRLTLLYDLWLLMRCQRIYKIPGWKESRGANIESAVAYNFNLFLIGKPDRTVIDRCLEALIKKQETSASEQPTTHDKTRA